MTGELNIDSIFCRAVEIASDSARKEFLEHACGTDAELRARIEKLLAAHAQAGSFMQDGEDVTVGVQHPAEQPGTRIGPYKLLQVIGEGGMGVVYMAEQTEPVKRRVALKIIKPGMDSRQVIARFEAERQALAMMDHPNIAKVLDAGSTNGGQPFFVMELVNGIPVTEYCDEQHLTPRERLELFVPICRAVQHAHQKGVIHRDLKPSNVLVALYDGKPIPKVIDFGVAKATSQKLTDRTLFTQFGQIVGTLEYMSPEQAQRNQLDVDTRSDIYSLGVLLYELLTGDTPFDRKRLRAAAFDELMRIIREEEPLKPSTKISSLGRDATATAESRNTNPESLRRAMRGDLDWIVMKALEKDRGRRYETAESFAADIRRFLGGEAIEARPPSTIYRMRKTAARHRLAFAATAVVILALGIGIIMSMRFAAIANVERRHAETQRNELRETLARLHDELIEKAVLSALSGDRDGTDEALKLAKDANIRPTMLQLLQGIANYHRGQNEEARELLEGVVQSEPDNVLAHAMLAITYTHIGDWNMSVREMLQIQRREQITQYKDHELLIVGYALLYFNVEQSLEILGPIVKRHPTWVVARAILGGGTAHRALELSRADLAEDALHETKLAFDLLGDNRLVAMFNLWVHHVNIHFAQKQGKPFEKLRQDAEALVQYLKENHADYGVGIANGAWFYETIGEFDAAAKLWSSLVGKKGNGIWMNAYAALLVQAGQAEQALAMLDERTQDTTSAKLAKAYFLAGIPERRTEALEICEELLAMRDPFDASADALEILCLLGARERVKDEAGRLLAVRQGSDSAVWLPYTCLAFYAGAINLEEFAAACQHNQVEQLVFHYTIAMWSLAQGNRMAAREHFVECTKTDQLSWGPYH